VVLDLVDTLRQLVGIASVNPMAGLVSGPDVGEARLTDHLESLLTQMGLVCVRQEVEPGRDNLVARLDGDATPQCGGPLILFGVHQDTVPVDGMTVKPFGAEIRQGRLYGRGACDVKGGMAAMLAAISRLAEHRPPGMPTIVLGCTVNEECGFTGARALASLCTGRPGGIVPRRPIAAVIAEPTQLQVVVAHKGVVRWRCHSHGRAVHSSQPEAGENAIYKMARGLMAIEQYEREVVGRLGSHPLCGRPTVSVGTIRGGVGVNVVPDHCVVEIDRRLLPGEDPEQARRQLIEYLQRQLGSEDALEHDPPFMTGLALSDERNQRLAARLEKVAATVVGSRRLAGVAYATDAAFLAAAGVPTVVFGPGSVDQAHTRDEWIALDELQKASEVYYRFALSGQWEG
jgi:acetylornithine deacetylase